MVKQHSSDPVALVLEMVLIELYLCRLFINMATFQSLGLCGDEHGIPREKLECNSYFSSMVLAVYDNILGPTILKIWTGRPTNSQGGLLSKYISCYTCM